MERTPWSETDDVEAALTLTRTRTLTLALAPAVTPTPTVTPTSTLTLTLEQDEEADLEADRLRMYDAPEAPGFPTYLTPACSVTAPRSVLRHVALSQFSR